MDRNVLDSLAARLPWLLANRALKHIGLGSGQGWQKTVDRLAGTEHPQAERFLSSILEDHILCGEKMTKVYRLPAEKTELLRQRINDLREGAGPFASLYPALMPEKELSEADEEPELVRVVRNDDGIGAIYSTVVNLTVRETIQPQTVEGGARLAEMYDEVIGLKYQPVQLFSVIWVSHAHDYLEIRTDFPRGMTQELGHQLQSQFRIIANNVAGEEIVVDPVDLFPLVNSMYSDASEGRVVQLGFNTSTGSVKNEKMRRSVVCLRNELYHVGGKKALSQPIQPFQVSIEWVLEPDGLLMVPELTLAGTSRGAHRVGGVVAGPVISAALIKNCLGSVDYGFVQDRILDHLSRIAPPAP